MVYSFRIVHAVPWKTSLLHTPWYTEDTLPSALSSSIPVPRDSDSVCLLGPQPHSVLTASIHGLTLSHFSFFLEELITCPSNFLPSRLWVPRTNCITHSSSYPQSLVWLSLACASGLAISKHRVIDQHFVQLTLCRPQPCCRAAPHLQISTLRLSWLSGSENTWFAPELSATKALTNLLSLLPATLLHIVTQLAGLASPLFKPGVA